MTSRDDAVDFLSHSVSDPVIYFFLSWSLNVLCFVEVCEQQIQAVIIETAPTWIQFSQRLNG